MPIVIIANHCILYYDVYIFIKQNITRIATLLVNASVLEYRIEIEQDWVAKNTSDIGWCENMTNKFSEPLTKGQLRSIVLSPKPSSTIWHQCQMVACKHIQSEHMFTRF